MLKQLLRVDGASTLERAVRHVIDLSTSGERTDHGRDAITELLTGSIATRRPPLSDVSITPVN